MAVEEDGRRRRGDFLSDLRLDWSALEFILSEGACLPGRRRAARSGALVTNRGPSEEEAVSFPDLGTSQPSEGGESLDASNEDVSSRRRLCTGCGRQRSFWCSTCCCPIGSEEATSRVPRVSLPLRVHVVRHPKEKASKSSAIPLKILAPKHVQLYEAHVGEGSESGRVVALPRRRPPRGEVLRLKRMRRSFDSRDAASGAEAEEDAEGESSGDAPPGWRRKGSVAVVLAPGPAAVPARCVAWPRVTDVVVLDCTWFQVEFMKKLPCIQGLPQVCIQGYESVFWRQHSKKQECYLSTAECVYFLLREVDIAARAEKLQLQRLSQTNGSLRVSALADSEFEALWRAYEGNYDAILFYFALTDKAIEWAKSQRRCTCPVSPEESREERLSSPAKRISGRKRDKPSPSPPLPPQ